MLLTAPLSTPRLLLREFEEVVRYQSHGVRTPEATLATPPPLLMERLGMRQEAHFRENAFIKGEWCDFLIYALLEREWRARTPASNG
ncbi:GNAT family N-acetyltransferase [Archangium violaceum]|uniref:GNAT family N-acetyltransferase n=1 Tax=Archangium violaceum TaxID=83451 RepID=UPI00193B9552|nr:GNAT family protein [Archangium violaceum]QRK08676.1 GNAT family N-acetyltransferase [Archangium violaceum]